MQYVVIEANGYNGRQALRLVHDKCVSASRRIDFFFQFTEFCVRYSTGGAIFVFAFQVIHELLFCPRQGKAKSDKHVHPRRLRVIMASN